MLPFYNLSRRAKMLFALMSIGGAAVFFWHELKKPDLTAPLISIEAAILLPALVLFLAIAASGSCARLLSEEKSKLDQTRRAALLGATVCAVLSAVSVIFRR